MNSTKHCVDLRMHAPIAFRGLINVGSDAIELMHNRVHYCGFMQVAISIAPVRNIRTLWMHMAGQKQSSRYRQNSLTRWCDCSCIERPVHCKRYIFPNNANVLKAFEIFSTNFKKCFHCALRIYVCIMPLRQDLAQWYVAQWYVRPMHLFDHYALCIWGVIPLVIIRIKIAKTWIQWNHTPLRPVIQRNMFTVYFTCILWTKSLSSASLKPNTARWYSPRLDK